MGDHLCLLFLHESVNFVLQMNILDGKTGLPILDHSVIDSVGSQMGGLSISIEGFGNDWLLYWTANCVGHEGSQSSYSFAKGVFLRLLPLFRLLTLDKMS